MTSTLFRVTLLAALCAQFAGAQFVNSKLKNKQHRIQTVLILPPQLRLTKVSIKGSEELPDEADQLGDQFQVILSNYLITRSAKILPHPLAGELNDTDRYALADLQRKYDAVEVQMLHKPKDVAKGRFSLGADMALYGRASGADALIFVRGRGTERRRSVADTMVPNLLWAGKGQEFDGRVTFVDARSGEVLVLLPFSTSGHGWRLTAEEVLPPLQECLLQLPVPLHEFLGQR